MNLALMIINEEEIFASDARSVGSRARARAANRLAAKASVKSAARRNDADFSFHARPLDYTGAITRAITARNQPTRSYSILCTKESRRRIWRNCASREWDKFYRLACRRRGRRRGPLSACRSCALNPFYSAARVYAVLMRKSDILAGPLLFLVPSALAP